VLDEARTRSAEIERPEPQQSNEVAPHRRRPGLRTAAWRAIWAALPNNAVWAARHQHLTTRADNPLKDGQARAALAVSLLRQLYVVVTARVAWDPAIADGTRREVTTPAA
jgi:hypothetical protein